MTAGLIQHNSRKPPTSQQATLLQRLAKHPQNNGHLDQRHSAPTAKHTVHKSTRRLALF